MSRTGLSLAVALVAAGLSLGSTASAECAVPTLEVRPRDAAVGDEIRIRGNAWGDACNDTPGPGCNPPPLGAPVQDIRLALRRTTTAESYPVGSVDADDDYSFELVVTIPQIPPGRYEVVDGRGEGDHSGKPLRVR